MLTTAYILVTPRNTNVDPSPTMLSIPKKSVYNQNASSFSYMPEIMKLNTHSSTDWLYLTLSFIILFIPEKHFAFKLNDNIL